MAFIHGKSAILLYGGTNLSPYFNDASVSRSVDTAETSAFGTQAKTYILGMEDGTLSASGMFDGDANAVDDLLRQTFGAAANDIVTFLPEGAADGKSAFSALVKQTSYEVSSPVGDVVATSVELQSDSGVQRAIALAGGKTVTTTGETTGVDNTASTSGGAVAFLHVTANTRDGASTFKVQQSSDGSTWADLSPSFASVPAGATTSERIVISGSIARYVRASHAPGGSTGSVTYTLTFARR